MSEFICSVCIRVIPIKESYFVGSMFPGSEDNVRPLLATVKKKFFCQKCMEKHPQIFGKNFPIIGAHE